MFPARRPPFPFFREKQLKVDVKEVKQAIDLKQCTRVSKGEYQLKVEG